MKRMTFWIVTLLTLCGLSACAGTSSKNTAVSSSLTGKTLVASGYSRYNDNPQLTGNQSWLMSQQTAKLNAYRSLAEQLYREPLTVQQTIGTQVMSNEVYRVYLDTYLREARATDYRSVKDTLKATLQITLTPRFYQCMAGDVSVVSQCLQQDNKLAFTRLGYKEAVTTSVSLDCGNRDCSDQYYVQGFARDRNGVDDVLLDLGMYDAEWTINTGARTILNYMLIDGLLNAL